MKERTALSILNLSRRFVSPAVDLERLLNLFPYPCLVVDTRALTVLFCNPAATTFSGWSIHEIIGSELASLFTDWVDPPSPLKSYSGTMELHISRGDRSIQKVLLHAHPLQERKQQAIAFLEAVEDSGTPSQGHFDAYGHYLNSMIALFDVFGVLDLPTALDRAASSGIRLIACDALTIYLAANASPELILAASAGETGGLPDLLPGKDLVLLSKPAMWEQSKRSQTTLHRIGRKSGFQMIATAPLGTTSATIGLVAAATRSLVATEYLIPALQIVASVITTLIESASLKTQLMLADLEQLRTKAYVHATDSAIHEGLVVVSPDHKILQINPATEAIFGYQADEVLQTSIENILIGSEKLLPRLAEIRKDDPPVHLEGIRLFRRYGESFLANVEMHPLCVEGILDRLLIVIKDLSESEHIREQAQQLEQRALLGEVMAIFAHEVRNPINNISTGLELMALRLVADDPQQELIQRLQQDCDRLADLMKSVLAFSKPVEFTLEPLHIPPLVQKLIDRSTPRLAKAGVKCQLRTEGNIPLILADYRSLEQALSNLIANAFQAMSETGGQLTIKIKTLKPQKLPGLREDIPYVEISIADTGPGIPKEHQDRIFQPFFTTNRNGTGLGLVITRRIITAHKGTIHLSSFPGGTVFYIRLPVAESA